jgi:hypothetical protein
MISSNSQFSSISVNLTPRQKRSIPLILRARSVEEGCRMAGITKQAWYKWMKDEGFAEEVRLRREAIVAESLDLLKAAVTGAVEGLTRLVDAEEASVRLRACGQVLDYFMKVRELEDMERRLVVLERAILGNETQTS